MFFIFYRSKISLVSNRDKGTVDMSFSRRFFKRSVLVAAAAASLVIGGGQVALAQGGGFRRPSIDAQAFNACTTTDYAGLVAKALNMTPAELRKDIVSGQTLQELASSANVDPQTVVAAYQTARKTDIDQAVKDGVMTQDEAAAIQATPAAPGTPAATAPAPAQGGRRGGPGGPASAPFPDISNLSFLVQQAEGTPTAPGNGGFGGGGIGLGIGAATFNLVKQYAVAAQALNIKCTDLVKTLITPPGKSISAVVAAQNIDPKTVSDALTKAYTDALAQDVTDGVITQAQSDQVTPLVAQAVAAFVSNPLPMGPQVTPTPSG
jgi:hypothetical protein